MKILKQDIKATSKKLSYQSKLNQRKSINKKFSINYKNVYRKFRGGNLDIQKIPLAKKLRHFGRTFGERNLISLDTHFGLKH